MVLKNISPGCRVRASLMLFLMVKILNKSRKLNPWETSLVTSMSRQQVPRDYELCM